LSNSWAMLGVQLFLQKTSIMELRQLEPDTAVRVHSWGLWLVPLHFSLSFLTPVLSPFSPSDCLPCRLQAPAPYMKTITIQRLINQLPPLCGVNPSLCKYAPINLIES
jgi:hypothetical protein